MNKGGLKIEEEKYFTFGVDDWGDPYPIEEIPKHKIAKKAREVKLKRGGLGKIKMDFYDPENGIIIDYKTTRGFPIQRSLEDKYATQAGYYTWVMNYLTGKPHTFINIAQSTDEKESYRVVITVYEKEELNKLVTEEIKPTIRSIQKFLKAGEINKPVVKYWHYHGGASLYKLINLP